MEEEAGVNMSPDYSKIKTFEEARRQIVCNPDEYVPERQMNRWDWQTSLTVQRILKLNPDFKNVVDYGYGLGRIAKSLSKVRHIEDLRAVDLENILAICLQEELEGDNVSWTAFHTPQIFLDIEDMEKATFIYSILTLQHMPKVEVVAVLEKFKEIISEDGMIYIEQRSWADDGTDHRVLIPETLGHCLLLTDKKKEIMSVVYKKKMQYLDAITYKGEER